MQIDTEGRVLVDCSVCNGYGEIRGDAPTAIRQRGRRRAKRRVVLTSAWHVCPACDGAGKVWRIIRDESKGATNGN